MNKPYKRIVNSYFEDGNNIFQYLASLSKEDMSAIRRYNSWNDSTTYEEDRAMLVLQKRLIHMEDSIESILLGNNNNG